MLRFARRLPVALPALAACGGWDAPEPAVDPALACAAELAELEPATATHPTGFRVVGNEIHDSAGERVFLRGVNRSGSEYRCIQGHGFFDGPDDEASVQAMAGWNINAVRVPLNETCWLAINDAPEELSGCHYKQAIKRYVNLLHAYDLIPILDLHWVGPGETQARRLQPMPTVDHSADFWRDVATTFLEDDGVIFEPFNEPFPDRNLDTNAAWECWLNGCDDAELWVSRTEVSGTYRAAGMQSLVSAIRSTGATQLLLLGGVQYSNGLSQWLEKKPLDPLDNLAVAWHAYNLNPCYTPACWNGIPAEVAAAVPVVATEFGQNDCMGGFVEPLMQFLDQHGSGYLAWSWNAYGECSPEVAMQRSNPWSLVTDYATGAPNGGYAQAVYDHLLQLGQ
jgi:hypothetical protein